MEKLEPLLNITRVRLLISSALSVGIDTLNRPKPGLERLVTGLSVS